MKMNLRYITSLMVFDPFVLSSSVKAFQLEVTGVPSRSIEASLNDEESKGTNERDQVAGKQDDVFDEVTNRESSWDPSMSVQFLEK